MNPVINKFLVALATAIAVIATLIADDDGMTTVDWLVVGESVLGAIGVYAVANGTVRS